MKKTNADLNPSVTIADVVLDVTADVCPMTFVRTRLALDRLPTGGTLLVVAKGAEPLANIPATARAQGHAVLQESRATDGTGRILLRKGAG
ncbi:MAG: sulfurtransferase TusA family protein [Rhodospirillales bacterium]|nr:sulfurtransferase TusA family protein [Rhodospirillales bacterium]